MRPVNRFGSDGTNRYIGSSDDRFICPAAAFPGHLDRWTDELMNRLFLVAALLFAASTRLTAQTSSPDEQRQADLSKIRSRIASLRGKLAESQKNVSTLSEEIQRLGWKIEIGQHETQLLSARREELTRQLHATETE